jgi:hypothetical protein
MITPHGQGKNNQIIYMKYFLAILLIALVGLSFSGSKCKHEFTTIEQAVIEIKQPSIAWVPAVWNPPSGRHEGNELICVKCFYKQKQIIDYGKPNVPGLTYQGAYIKNCLDTSIYGTSISTGSLVFKPDSLIWSK